MNSKVKQIILSGLIAFCMLSSGKAQAVTIETVLDTHNIRIGEQTELSYLINKNTNDSIGLPYFYDTISSKIEIINEAVTDSTYTGGKTTIVQKMTITSFDVGTHLIPSIPYVFKTYNVIDTLWSQQSYLKVLGVDIDTTGTIRDVKPPVSPAYKLVDFTEVFLLIFLTAILVIILLVSFKRKKKGKAHFIAKPKEPAHIVALRNLDKLKAQKLWQKQQVKEYYTRLTEIIRTYIENSFSIKAMEKTTSEILTDLKKVKSANDINKQQLQSLLNLADLVKFAKGDPLPEENVEHLDNAYDFVKSTLVMLEELKAKQESKEAGE